MNAFCRLCRTVWKPKISILEKHENSTQHLQSICTETESLSRRQKNSHVSTALENKIAEIKLAMAVCCHWAIRAIDHMIISEIVPSHSKGSPLGQMKMYLTKCFQLISHCNAVCSTLLCHPSSHHRVTRDNSCQMLYYCSLPLDNKFVFSTTFTLYKNFYYYLIGLKNPAWHIWLYFGFF